MVVVVCVRFINSQVHSTAYKNKRTHDVYVVSVCMCVGCTNHVCKSRKSYWCIALFALMLRITEI